MSATHYHAGSNTVGYLSEQEPTYFETFEDAKRYLIGEIDRHGDFLFESAEEMPMSAADDLSGMMEDLDLINGPEFHSYSNDAFSEHTLDIHWWIVQCDDAGCEDTDY